MAELQRILRLTDSVVEGDGTTLGVGHFDSVDAGIEPAVDFRCGGFRIVAVELEVIVSACGLRAAGGAIGKDTVIAAVAVHILMLCLGHSESDGFIDGGLAGDGATMDVRNGHGVSGRIGTRCKGFTLEVSAAVCVGLAAYICIVIAPFVAIVTGAAGHGGGEGTVVIAKAGYIDGSNVDSGHGVHNDGNGLARLTSRCGDKTVDRVGVGWVRMMVSCATQPLTSLTWRVYLPAAR